MNRRRATDPNDPPPAMKIHIQVNGKPYEVEVELDAEGTFPTLPANPIGMETIQSAVVPTSATDNEQNVCRSPLTGIVVRVQVRPGTDLRPGDPIAVLEAMKMETKVTAAAAARVKCVKVAEGEAVRTNQVLVEFEASSENAERSRSCS
jgi:methylmalonyl-CoA carboxyltransferase small subunit